MFAVLVIVASTVLVYSNSFDASFHFDDLVFRNEGLRDLQRLSMSSNRYLGYLSFAINYRLAGLEVFGFHLANVLIHVCNALLVYALAGVTLRTPALQHADAGPLVRRYLPLVAALLFAVHPLATQAVTYVVQRFTSLATLFYLLTLVLYATARVALEADPPSKIRPAALYGLSMLSAIAAMKSKEISFTLPFIVAGYELLFFPRRRFVLLPPLFATALLIPLGLAARDQGLADVLGDASRLAAETNAIPRSVYLLTQFRVVLTYLRLLVVPVGQNLDYDFPLSRSLADPNVLFALAILVAVAAIAVGLLVAARRRNQAAGVLVFFGVAWFFVTLSVESSLIPISDVIFEHRVYLPSPGAAIAIGTALLWAVERLRWRVPLPVQSVIVLVLTAGPLAVAAHVRNRVWKDDVSLWSDVVAKSPGKWRPHEWLGVAQLDRGAIEEATREFLIVVSLVPEHANGHKNLGLALRASGRLDEAIRECREAVRLDSGLADAHNCLCDVHQAKGQVDDAVRECREAVRLDPDLADSHNNLGTSYIKQGRPADAIVEIEKAIALTLAQPSTSVTLRQRIAEAHNNLGAAYEASGRLEDAEREFRDVLRRAPGVAEAHNNLALILMKQGRFEEGIEECRRAVELKPVPEIVLNFAVALEQAGRPDEAIVEYQRFVVQAGPAQSERAESVKARLAHLRGSR